MSSLYLDASALTKLVLDEPETAALQEAVRGRLLVSSRVSVVEVTKAVARTRPEADPTLILDVLLLVELEADLARSAGTTGGHALRALDAIHIASAQLLGPEVEMFITYDSRQAEAARGVGLQVAAPGRVEGDERA